MRNRRTQKKKVIGGVILRIASRGLAEANDPCTKHVVKVYGIQKPSKGANGKERRVPTFPTGLNPRGNVGGVG